MGSVRSNLQKLDGLDRSIEFIMSKLSTLDRIDSTLKKLEKGVCGSPTERNKGKSTVVDGESSQPNPMMVDPSSLPTVVKEGKEDLLRTLSSRSESKGIHDGNRCSRHR